MPAGTTATFPELVLDLGDLLLRPFEAADGPGIVDACSDPVTQHWLPLPSPYTELDARLFIDGAEDFRITGTGLRCAIARGEDNVLLAGISLNHTNWTERVTAIGYWCRPEFRGRGVISRAARALSLWALEEGMERVELRAAPGNDASNRVARNAGFTLEGMLRNAGFIHAGRVDLNVYSLIRADREKAG